MGMFHSTSGKSGFAPYEIATNFTIEKSLLQKILMREDELRASDQYQEEWSQSDDLSWMRDVAVKIQKRALEEFGITDPKGLIVLQNARFKYKDDSSMNKLTIYMREDRSRKGDLQYLDEAPNAKLYTLEGKKKTNFT